MNCNYARLIQGHCQKISPNFPTIGLWLLLGMLCLNGCAKRSLAPGKVISHSYLETGVYLGSPSLAILPNGDYIASFDTFGPMTFFGKNGTFVFSSKNKGKTWEQLAYLPRFGWCNLFYHDGALYLMGTMVSFQDDELRSVVISKSVDGGVTWTDPTDSQTGLLVKDGKSYHTSAVPVALHRGRIWRAMEDSNGAGDWGVNFRAYMMSAPQSADLLNAENWTMTNHFYGNEGWLDGRFGGWLEGNALVDRQGQVVNLLRVYEPARGGVAALVDVVENGQKLSFDPAKGFVQMPGGSKKFTVRYDPDSKKYWSLTNYVMKDDLGKGVTADHVRNTVALVFSEDLRNWQVKEVLLHHEDPATHALQYIDWLFDGSDIIAVARTTWEDEMGIPKNPINSNYITFHRFQNFRN